MEGTEDPWLYTSGLKGPLKFDIRLSNDETRDYTVRLHFVEPEDATPDERVFEVTIGGKKLIPAIDIAKEAGGKDRAHDEQLKREPNRAPKVGEEGVPK